MLPGSLGGERGLRAAGSRSGFDLVGIRADPESSVFCATERWSRWDGGRAEVKGRWSLPWRLCGEGPAAFRQCCRPGRGRGEIVEPAVVSCG